MRFGLAPRSMTLDYRELLSSNSLELSHNCGFAQIWEPKMAKQI